MNLLLITIILSSFCLANAVTNRTFPKDFLFGVATASYQVEGGWNEDGKGENVWDHITHTNPDFVVNRDNGDVACDSYHKYKEDVQLMKELGVNHYRFSLSWSRILPTGFTNKINEAGVQYYKNLIKELKDNNIIPMVTLYHWDLPQPLQDIGGWPNPDLAEHFANYARIAFELFGDDVKTWLTFNEPTQSCYGGYAIASNAPGIKAPGIGEYLCAHTILKAHAKAYHIYDKEFRAKQNGRVSIVIDCGWYEPSTNKTEDVEAAERVLQFSYGWYANPIVYGNYPEVMIDRIAQRSKKEGYLKSRLPEFTKEEIEYIKGTHDFLAVNTYTTSLVNDSSNKAVIPGSSWNDDMEAIRYSDPKWKGSASDWLKIVPWGIRKLLVWLKKTYNNPEIIITENGVSETGTLKDDIRIRYYRDYLSNILDAILIDKVNLTAYTAWSLMDNYEWKQGYSVKFGLYHVDFNSKNKTRTP